MVTLPRELRNDQVEEQHLFPPCWVLVVQAAGVGGATAEGGGNKLLRRAGPSWEGDGPDSSSVHG